MFGIGRVDKHEITYKHVSRCSAHTFLKLYPGVDISQEEDVYPSEYISMLTQFCAILNIKKVHRTRESAQGTIDTFPLPFPEPLIVVYTRFRKGIEMIRRIKQKLKFN